MRGVTTANNNGRTPLNSASDSGHVDVVKLLLEKGADMTVTNNGGWTPLNLASGNGHVDLVQLLLEKGADPSGLTNYQAVEEPILKGIYRRQYHYYFPCFTEPLLL